MGASPDQPLCRAGLDTLNSGRTKKLCYAAATHGLDMTGQSCAICACACASDSGDCRTTGRRHVPRPHCRLGCELHRSSHWLVAVVLGERPGSSWFACDTVRRSVEVPART